MAILAQQNYLTNAKSCYFHNNSAVDSNCEEQIWIDLNNGTKGCPCSIDCFHTQYDTTISASNFPALKYIVSRHDSSCTNILSKKPTL